VFCIMLDSNIRGNSAPLLYTGVDYSDNAMLPTPWCCCHPRSVRFTAVADGLPLLKLID